MSNKIYANFFNQFSSLFLVARTVKGELPVFSNYLQCIYNLTSSISSKHHVTLDIIH